MSQHYSDPDRASDPGALPNVETFFVSERDAAIADTEGSDPREPGWYYWFCFPGCLPDTDPCGPFDSEADALADARDVEDDCEAGTLAEDDRG